MFSPANAIQQILQSVGDQISRPEEKTDRKDGVQELQEAQQILNQLKTPVLERRIERAAIAGKDTTRGVNEVATAVEETLRIFSPQGFSAHEERAEQITLAKNYVTADGDRDERERSQRDLDRKAVVTPTFVAHELKEGIGEGHKQRQGETIPNADALSNASPEAHKIESRSAINLSIPEELHLSITEQLKQSLDNIGRKEAATVAPVKGLSTPLTIEATRQRMEAMTRRLEKLALAA
jgi:hypothetical protein